MDILYLNAHCQNITPISHPKYNFAIIIMYNNHYNVEFIGHNEESLTIEEFETSKYQSATQFKCIYISELDEFHYSYFVIEMLVGGVSVMLYRKKYVDGQVIEVEKSEFNNHKTLMYYNGRILEILEALTIDSYKDYWYDKDEDESSVKVVNALNINTNLYNPCYQLYTDIHNNYIVMYKHTPVKKISGNKTVSFVGPIYIKIDDKIFDLGSRSFLNMSDVSQALYNEEKLYVVKNNNLYVYEEENNTINEVYKNVISKGIYVSKNQILLNINDIELHLNVF
jgi:hypothetical protein